jgi:hypothetical protein
MPAGPSENADHVHPDTGCVIFAVGSAGPAVSSE